MSSFKLTFSGDQRKNRNDQILTGRVVCGGVGGDEVEEEGVSRVKGWFKTVL